MHAPHVCDVVAREVPRALNEWRIPARPTSARFLSVFARMAASAIARDQHNVCRLEPTVLDRMHERQDFLG